MTKKTKRIIKDNIANARAIINHEAIGAGVLQKKLKHKVTRLNKLIHG